ncbi:alpha/beta hydrolase [Segetibacter aerophilus]|uniref:Alpha/beta hydrolase n=1 Tax=Segetibacter aerophilus TaxID=670293 RepID=A0A512BHL9_9BACT|nr:alpha/beta fold hydrolase [Segetibacter aerophilus]GEO11476.1 alpha/beta hydrolase [Segetibacter aerophilus]
MKKLLRQVARLLLFIFVLLNIVAAFHAYKFTHFYDKGHTAVKKPELMDGWDKTKAILFGIDYFKLPIAATPTHPYQTTYIKTTDSIILEGWYVPKDSAKGTVILFHGHGGNKGGVLTEAENFYNYGYNVCLVDFRAHGNSKGNICTIGFDESHDVKAVYDFIKAKGEKNIILWGISLGAATITKAMSDYKDIQPAKIILEMPFASLTDAVKGRLRIMHLPSQPLATMLTFWGGVEQRFWAFNHEPAEYAKSIKVPVLLQWGQNDFRVSETETKEIFDNLPSQKKHLTIYAESGHQSLAKNEPGKWNETVKAFLEDK